MATPPTRAEISGTPSRATANTGFGKLWDYVTGLLGSTGNAPEARAALGATATGAALFTAADAAAARLAAGVPNSGPLSGLRNLVINGNFSVNQRSYTSGTATTGANQYTLDRWRVVTSGQAVTFTTTGAGRTVTAPSGGIEQVIEGASIGGGAYVVNWSGTASCTVNSVSRAKGATFTLTAGSNVTVRFSSGTVTDVQIEPGEVVTAFELRPAAVELMLCQRYYQTVTMQSAGWTGSGTTNTYRTPLPVVMRAIPTVVSTPITNTNVTGSAITAPSADSVAIGSIGSSENGYISSASATLSAEL